MKKFIAALLSVFVLASPVVANNAFLAPSEIEIWTKRAGLPTEGIGFEIDPEQALNAGFIPGGIYCSWFFCTEYQTTIVFLGDWSFLPYEARVLTLLHELGHYKQYLEGRPFDEWDADVYAAETACRLGLDGVYWIEKVAAAFIDDYDSTWEAEEGTRHGSWNQRVENVKMKATGCREKYTQGA